MNPDKTGFGQLGLQVPERFKGDEIALLTRANA